MDRMDLWVTLQAVEPSGLHSEGLGESSAAIRERVVRARKWQEERFYGSAYRFNGDIRAEDLPVFCPLGEKEKRLAEQLYDSLGLSARGYHRMLRVARTIADMEEIERIGEEQLLEAAGYHTRGW